MSLYTRTEVARLTHWAAQECEWQQVGPLKVGYLIDAYFYLAKFGSPRDEIAALTVQTLGLMVEPDMNLDGEWRHVNVIVARSLKVRWEEVPELMDDFLGNLIYLDPTERFREFEEIHPFVDGNGRVGSLLYNWWNGTFAPSDLMFPPNLWADERREEVTL